MGRLLLLSMFFVASSIQAQECPTIEISNQQFCDYQWVGALNRSIQPTVNFLEIKDNGGGVVWYLEQTGGTPLTGEELLEDGVIYYADNSVGNCAERASVTVLVDTFRAAGKTSQAYICLDSQPAEIWDLMTPIDDVRPVVSGGKAYIGSEEVPTLIDPREVVSGTTYTYEAPPSLYGICNGGKPDTASLTIFIGKPADAGEGGEFELLTTDGAKNFMTLLGETAQPGGTWYPAIPESGEFDPSMSGAGIFTYTYTVEYITPVGNNATGPRSVKCEDSATVEITVIEPVDDEKAILCHKGKTLEVDQDAVQAHLDHGDTLGECSSTSVSNTVVSPNPSYGDFNFSNDTAEIQKVRILNFKGGVEKEFTSNGDPNLLEINLGQLKKGIYFAEVFTTNGKEVLRLVKK